MVAGVVLGGVSAGSLGTELTQAVTELRGRAAYRVDPVVLPGAA
jgi:hypothetical protein